MDQELLSGLDYDRQLHMTTEPTVRVDAMSQACVRSTDERRVSPRQRCLNGAKIVFNNNSSVIDCVVRDLSPQGARLLVASLVGIPDRFADRSQSRLPTIEDNLASQWSDRRAVLLFTG